jgi:O-antigen/teichoic acid export membrane protein
MPRRLLDYARGLSLAMGTPLTPYFASFVGNRDSSVLQENWLKSSLAIHTVTGAMPVLILLCGSQFISIWLGPVYGESSYWVLKFMLIGFVVESLSPNAGRVLSAKNKHGNSAKMWLTISILCLPLAILGANIWGLVGVALASSIAGAVGSVLTLNMALQSLEISIYRYLKETILPLLIPLIAFGTTLWFTKYLPFSGYTKIIGQCVISLSAYLMILWILVLSTDVKRQIKLKLGIHIANC